MAIVETGNIFNSLIFGGVRSVDYGIYITGEAVYNVPVRAVEMVSVPGRNGAIAIDQGYWENIEVSYPAGCFGSTQAEFAEAIARFRNAIASQVGYKRLTDTYHPEEYRMAMYISGLEVEAVQSGKAGEFTLTFDAKPQRFLITGEERTTLTTSGATIPNPALNEASPLIEVEGYGTLTVNGYEIEIENAMMGNVVVANESTKNASVPIGINTDYFNVGDTMTISRIDVSWHYDVGTFQNWRNASATDDMSYAYSNGMKTLTISTTFTDLSITTGTASSSSKTGTVTFDYYKSGAQFRSYSITPTVNFAYDNTTNTIAITVSGYAITLESGMSYSEPQYKTSDIYVDSTIPILGNPTYIDCDLGVCYKIENDTVIDLNSYIDLGSDLPVLSPGSNTVTFDNTITSVGFIPRWWIL